jgi:DNA invertase Pin-like site-specific DNA recombinase
VRRTRNRRSPTHDQAAALAIVLTYSNSVRRYSHSGDRVLASNIAAAFAASNVSAVPLATRSSQQIVLELKNRGVALRATEQPVDTGTAAGKAFLDMLGVFAEFETNLRRERQLEGIAQAKARGVYRGRKPSIDMAEIRRLRDQDGLGATAIARRLGIGRASVYRALGAP